MGIGFYPDISAGRDRVLVGIYGKRILSRHLFREGQGFGRDPVGIIIENEDRITGFIH